MCKIKSSFIILEGRKRSYIMLYSLILFFFLIFVPPINTREATCTIFSMLCFLKIVNKTTFFILGNFYSNLIRAKTFCDNETSSKISLQIKKSGVLSVFLKAQIRVDKQLFALKSYTFGDAQSIEFSKNLLNIHSEIFPNFIQS